LVKTQEEMDRHGEGRLQTTRARHSSSNRDDSTSLGMEEPGEAAYARIRVATAIS